MLTWNIFLFTNLHKQSETGRWLLTGGHIVRDVIRCSNLNRKYGHFTQKLKLGAGFYQPSSGLLSKGIGRQGAGSLRKRCLCFNTMPRRPMPLHPISKLRLAVFGSSTQRIVSFCSLSQGANLKPSSCASEGDLPVF